MNSNVNTTERLIQEVRARQPLWDQRNLNYHNRVVVNSLWQDIADLLQVNKETVKVKWKGLRDTYRRELKKQRCNAHMQNGDNARDPSWTHYSSMNFLREYMGSNNNHSDLFHFQGWSADDLIPDEAISTPPLGAMSPFEPQTSLCETVANKNDLNGCTSREDTTRLEPKIEPFFSPREHEDAERSVSKKAPRLKKILRISRLKEHRLRSRLSRKHPRMRDGSSRFSNAPQSDDSDDDLHFFKSLVPYMKPLSPMKKLYLRSEIQNLVIREILAESNGSISLIPLEHVTVGMNS